MGEFSQPLQGQSVYTNRNNFKKVKVFFIFLMRLVQDRNILLKNVHKFLYSFDILQ